MGIEQAKNEGADIVLGTDPDADRVGVGVRVGTDYVLMTGNQIGALLVDFILARTDLSKFNRPAIVKTVVTSELGAMIAEDHGIKVFSTLTGFKFIGEKVTQFEAAKEANNPERNYDFLFGYEESFGYLAGTHARYKDAVVSSLLICEMAAALKNEGYSLFDRLQEIYTQYGYFYDALNSFTLEGKDGLIQITNMMSTLRERGSLFPDVAKVIDYSIPISAEHGFGNLPASNVLKYVFSDNSWVAVRPSGTEPKIKIYYSVRGKNLEDAEARFERIKQTITSELNLE